MKEDGCGSSRFRRIPNNSLQAGSPLSHARERRRAKQSGGMESGEEPPPLPRCSILRLRPRTLVLQRDPAHARGLCKRGNRKV